MSKVFVEYNGGLIDADKIETIEHRESSVGIIDVHTGGTQHAITVAETAPRGGPSLNSMTNTERSAHGARAKAAAHSLADAIGKAGFRARQESETYIVRYSNENKTWLYAQARHNESGVSPFEDPKES